jgi:TM2 domain-containing membrane protein YozV
VVCPGCGVAQAALVPAGRQHPDAVLGLILNLIIPGVGSLVIGQTQAGIIQLVLLILSVPLSFVLIGIPLAIAVWVWALVVSVQSFSNYTGPPRAPA